MTRRDRTLAGPGGDPDDCWLWTGAISPEGYGRIGRAYVHRLSCEQFVGPIPRGFTIDHVCHTAALAAGECDGTACQHRRCWNPAHLEAVTLSVNTLRGNGMSGRHARKTHCDSGHEFTTENTYIRPDTGTRQCLACCRERGRVRLNGWQRQRDAAQALLARCRDART